MTPYEAIMKLMTTAITVMVDTLICVVLFQIGMKRLWPKYPFPGFKKGFFLFVTLLGVHAFISSLIKGWSS